MELDEIRAVAASPTHEDDDSWRTDRKDYLRQKKRLRARMVKNTGSCPR